MCISGELISQDLYFSSDTGIITPNYYYRQEGVERIDLDGKVVAPGFLDLQTNGMQGLHFSHLRQGGGGQGQEDEAGDAEDEKKLERVSQVQVCHGVTAWWATVPTVESTRWKQVSDML